ncbi:DUF4367 domain-containing protein [Bacillus suaedae]|uniref:DUF4367 domain-containing protein n=1 Tax=Halalkalibacter suaedae TaxID=2822140 RepID=A0A941ARR4_9BACI|nr:DUF4367 domain-containing protein [Bacillus suaedae]MBP3953113.1 DUF4367 domain-containing protein [Bacillus suaedae]
MNHSKFDQFVKDVLEEELEGSPPPISSKDDIWRQIQKKQHSSKKSKSKRRNVMYAAAILFLAFGGSIVFPQQSSSFGFITNLFSDVQGTVKNTFITSSDETEFESSTPTNEYVHEDGQLVIEQMSLEEAQKATTFPIITPGYIPEGFSLVDVTIVKREGQLSNDISLNYQSDEDRAFRIKQQSVEEGMAVGLATDIEDTLVEDIVIHGQPATLMIFESEKSEILWVTQQHYFSIKGELSREEIEKVANSL